MRNPFSRIWSNDEQEVFNFLKGLPLFANLTEKELNMFLPNLHERTYRIEEVVFFRNDPSHALYILRKGKVNLNLDVNDNFEVLTELTAGSVFGDNCILDGTKRPMNAIVVSEEANFYVIPKDNLLKIFENRLEIKAKMMESLALINEMKMKKLFKFYRSTIGLFNLGDIYKK